MSTLGRLLQILGLTLLPLAIILEISGTLGRNSVADMLLMLIFGAAAFYLGRYLEGYARS